MSSFGCEFAIGLFRSELLLLFMYDFPRQQEVQLALCNDDTAYYFASRGNDLICRQLRWAVMSTVEWSSRWRPRINENKCVAIRFTRRRCLHHDYTYPPLLEYLRSVSRGDPLPLSINIPETAKNFLAARSLLLSLLCRRSPLSF